MTDEARRVITMMESVRGVRSDGNDIEAVTETCSFDAEAGGRNGAEMLADVTATEALFFPSASLMSAGAVSDTCSGCGGTEEPERLLHVQILWATEMHRSTTT